MPRRKAGHAVTTAGPEALLLLLQLTPRGDARVDRISTAARGVEANRQLCARQCSIACLFFGVGRCFITECGFIAEPLVLLGVAYSKAWSAALRIARRAKRRNTSTASLAQEKGRAGTREAALKIVTSLERRAYGTARELICSGALLMCIGTEAACVRHAASRTTVSNGAVGFKLLFGVWAKSVQNGDAGCTAGVSREEGATAVLVRS